MFPQIAAHQANHNRFASIELIGVTEKTDMTSPDFYRYQLTFGTYMEPNPPWRFFTGGLDNPLFPQGVASAYRFIANYDLSNRDLDPWGDIRTRVPDQDKQGLVKSKEHGQCVWFNSYRTGTIQDGAVVT